jgi:hypothetical protein
MALGDPGIEPVHQAGKLDEPCSGVGRDIGPVLIGPVLIGTVLIGTVLIGTVLIGTGLIGTVLIGTGLIGTVVLSIRLKPLSDGLIQGPRLRAFLHRAMVQNADS